MCLLCNVVGQEMPEGVTKCRSLNDLAVQRGPIKSAGRVHNGFGNWAGLARLRCTPEIDKQYMCQKLIPPVFPLLVGDTESMSNRELMKIWWLGE